MIGILKVQYLVNMADESELPSQTVAVFTWLSKKYWSYIILMEDFVFSVDYFWQFFMKHYFQLV